MYRTIIGRIGALCTKPTLVVTKDEWETPAVKWAGFCTRTRWHLGECIDHTQMSVIPRQSQGPDRNGLFANRRGGVVVGITMLVTFVATWLILNILGASPASAHQPYGGCDEAWQAPKSAGANHCRKHGWLVRPRVVVGPKGWVHHNRLPACTSEDMIGCYWNGSKMGDGSGRSVVSVPTKDGSGYIRFVRTRSLP